MSMFVWVTDSCRQEAQRHGMSDAIDVLAKQIEKTQNTLMFDRFPNPYIVKKKFTNRQGRLIGSEHLVKVDGEEHKIVLLLSVMIRGSDDYDSIKGFGHDPDGYGRKNLIPIIERYKLQFEEYIRNRTRVEPPEPKPDLQGGEVNYISEAVSTGTNANENSIAESRHWIEKVSGKIATLPRIRDLVSDILAMAEEGGREPDLHECSEAVPQNKRLRIAYQWLSKGRILYLYDLFEDGQKPEGAITSEKLDQAERSFYRAYPTWMLSDEELWIQLEQDRFGNFSLSPEENEILHPKDGKGLQFPLFINGRAGSGKSTILQYIYAEYLARYAKLGSSAGKPPAYFACNGELIRSATKLVRSILLNNPAYSGTAAIKSLVEDDTLFAGSFHVYHEYLLSLLTAPERCRHFPDGRYVDYAKFTKLWIGKFGKEPSAYREYGPDISWHVIRTFIKGLSTDGIIEEADYAFLRRSDKSVSEETFSKIYKSVWEAWYQKETDPDLNAKRYWDDQDLVRYVLEKDLIKRAGAASLGIFCDEAQDFTHIELESFLRLSVFSERSVWPHDIGKIPFVFAGDEFQTLNPTGFNWDSVKSAFVEKFVFGICPIADEAKSSVHLVDLKNNYRSIPNIVRFGNSVQALRAAKFDLSDVKPQLEWKEDEGRPVSYFRSDDESFWNALKAREDVHVIVPCHANEELEFIRKDPVLRSHVEINEQQGTTRPPVMSTVRAKGLEYPCVVVYGFGSSLVKSDGDLLDFSDRPDEDRTRFLSLEYFLNRLYVAVSRPRSQLYVCDTADGRKRLWRFAESAESVNKVLKHVKKADGWKDHVESFVDGTAKHLSAGYTFNPEEMAKQYEAAGMADHDPVQLNYAATFYAQCKDKKNKVKSCQAFALLFQEHYEEAANLFREINEFESAGDCYWKMKSDRGWSAMADLARKQSALGTRIEYSAAKALTSRTAQSVTNVLDAILKELDGEERDVFATPEWSKAITELASFVEKDKGAMDKAVLDLFVRLIKAGIVPARTELVEQAFNAGYLDIAYDLLPLAGIQKGRIYQRIMFAKLGYPKCLAYYQFNGAGDSAEDDEQILASHASAPDAAKDLDLTGRLAISRAHLHRGKILDVRDIVLGLNDASAFDTLADEAESERDRRTFHRLALSAMAASAPLDVILVNLNAEITQLKAVTLDAGYIVSILARKPLFKREVAMVDFGIRKSIADFLGAYVNIWRNSSGLTTVEKEVYVSAGEIGAALEHFGNADEDSLFYKNEFKRTKNTDLAARWVFIQDVRMRQMHGPKLANLKREVDAFRRSTGIRHGIGSLDKLFNSQWQLLRERMFPSAHDLELREAAIRAAKAALAEGKTPNAAPAVQEQPDAAVVPEVSEPSKVESDKKEKAVREEPADVNADSGKSKPKATIAGEADGKDKAEPVDGASVDEPKSADAHAESTTPAEPPAPKEQTVSTKNSVSAASPRLRLAPDRFRLTYFAARGRLNILDMETGDQWNVSKTGLSIEGEDKGHVSSMAIGETGFTITTSQKCIVLRDDRCGYEFTIMF